MYISPVTVGVAIEARKEFLQKKKCAECNYDSDFQLLEFRRPPPPDRPKHDISTMISLGIPLAELRSAMGSCEILCANCNTRRTAIECNSFRHVFMKTGNIVPREPASRYRNHTYIIHYLEAHPCTCCGETDLRVLDFDHIFPSTKLYNVTTLINSSSMKKLCSEIAKCRVLCRMCHRSLDVPLKA